MTEQTETPENKLPTIWDVLRADLPNFSTWILQQITHFFEWLFSTTAAAGARRLILVIGISAIWWARASMNILPITLTGNLFHDIILYPLDALFMPQIMRHVVLSAMMFWLIMRLAARYLDDIFELNDIFVAEKYLLQAIFGSDYDTINIRESDVAPEHMNSPIIRIGGPGKVKVHFDNAVLFEQANGSPEVYSPNDTISLARFERLRSVIDLREQVADMTVRERTKDGIHITAQGTQIVYSISRGGKEPTLEQPHPFDNEAIKKIVYSQGSPKSFKSRQDKTSQADPIDTINPTINMPGFIQGQLRTFINKHLLSEFLTSIQQPEIEAKQKEKERLAEETQKFAKTPTAKNPKEELSTDSPIDNAKDENIFTTRDKITQQFYDEINKTAKKRGMELHWIDIGTWVFPENTRKIHEQHLDAWNLAADNLKRGSEKAFEKSFKTAKRDELQRLYREVPLNAYFQYNHLKDEDSDYVIRMLLLSYWDRFRPVWRTFQDRGEKAPEEIEFVTRYLRMLLPRYPDEGQKATNADKS